jgi:7-cyano-7-deazaguanine synthase
MEKSLVLFSGGIDSTTALYWALNKQKKITALSFAYGQRHKIEICLAQKTTSRLKIPHRILRVDLNQIGGSSLTDLSLSLPEFKNSSEIKQALPSSYVPFRNGIFLSLAAAWAEVNGIWEIICGFHVFDSPHYPDTRLPFVQAMEKAINEGTGAAFGRKKIRILTPFLNKKKSGLIREGLKLGADYSYSVSCYRGLEVPCQRCSSCLLRQKAWEEVGKKDPLYLRLEKEGKL